MSTGPRETLADGAAVPRRAELPRCDYLVGGFPCQDLSSAGKRVGIEGERSGLYREFLRLIDECQPRGIVIENVHHAWKRWVPLLRRELWARRYASLPLRLRASDFGAWHERSRVFLVAHVDASVLRLESWRREWPFWETPPLFTDADAGRQPELGRSSIVVTRESGAVADADSPGCAHGEGRGTDAEQRGLGPVAADVDALRELQPQGRESDQWRRAGDGGWWTTEPDVVRVVHGVSSRLDGRRMAARIAALGNAVVPPEVLWIAQRLIEAERAGAGNSL